MSALRRLLGIAVSRERIHGQFMRFVLIGVASTVLDALAYRLALEAASTDVAKAIGYLVGMTFSITCNYRWTFGYAGPGRTGVVVRCVLIYAAALLLNVASNRLALAVLPDWPATMSAAFVFAVGVCTVFNFTAMRLWAFRGDRAA